MNTETEIGRRKLLQMGLTAGTLMAVTGLILPGAALARGKGGLIYMLGGAVDKENRAVWAYRTAAATGKLSPAVAKVATTFLGQHAEHAAALAQVIDKLGGSPPSPRENYDLSAYHPDLSSQEGILKLALALEADAVQAYHGAVAELQERGIREAAASILGDEAMHVAVLRNALGLEPVPSAFITGKGLRA